MEKDKEKHQDEIVEREGIRDEEMKRIRKYIAIQIERLKEEKSQEFTQMKKKQDITFEMEKKLSEMENMALFMKGVKIPTGFTLSASGWPLIKWPYLGDYTLTSSERNGQPVYRHSDSASLWPLYCQEDGTWAIEGWVAEHDTQVVYRSKDAAVIPALCQHWEHKGPVAPIPGCLYSCARHRNPMRVTAPVHSSPL